MILTCYDLYVFNYAIAYHKLPSYVLAHHIPACFSMSGVEKKNYFAYDSLDIHIGKV